MEKVLENYHLTLNRDDILPDIYLRRNAIHYPLVCYVNNIICLYMSSNFSAIPLFIRRIHEHIETYEKTNLYVEERYFRLVREYTALISEFLEGIGLSSRDFLSS